MYIYLKDNNDEDKKTKGTKTCIIKKVKFQDYKNGLEVAEIERKINSLRKNKINVVSKKIKKNS